MVEQVFGFLPSMIGGQEGQAPSRFEVRWALSFKVQPGRARPSSPDRLTSGLTEKQPRRGAGRAVHECALWSRADEQRKGRRGSRSHVPGKQGSYLPGLPS